MLSELRVNFIWIYKHRHGAAIDTVMAVKAHMNHRQMNGQQAIKGPFPVAVFTLRTPFLPGNKWNKWGQNKWGQTPLIEKSFRENKINKWGQTPLIEKSFRENNDFKRVNAK